MIYRIYQDHNYKVLNLTPMQLLKLAGKIDNGVKNFHVDFFKDNKNVFDELPDLSEIGSYIYVSQYAYDVLRVLIVGHGKFIPVTHEAGNGFIFCVSSKAEDYNGIDVKCIVKDINGNLNNIIFNEKNLQTVPIFQSELLGRAGIYSNETFKEICSASNLKGVIFSSNLVHPF